MNAYNAEKVTVKQPYLYASNNFYFTRNKPNFSEKDNKICVQSLKTIKHKWKFMTEIQVEVGKQKIKI